MTRRPVIIRTEFAEEWARDVRRWPEEGLMGAMLEYHVAIKEAMEQQGVTRAELARRAQLKPSYVSRVLNNPENITLRTAFRLCHALDLQLGFDMKPYPDPLYSEPKPRRTRAQQPPTRPTERSTRRQAAV